VSHVPLVRSLLGGLLLLAAGVHAAPLHGVRAVTVSPDGVHVYAASEFAASVVAFQRSAATGDLTPIQTVLDAPGGPLLDTANSVALSPDGRHLYVAAFAEGAVNVFARDAATGLSTFVEAVVDGVDGLQRAHGAVVSPDGAHVYVAGYEEDAVAVFAREPVSGTLSFVEAVRDGVGGVDGLDGVLRVALSPDGSHLYAAGAVDGAVSVFARAAGTGALTFLQALRTGDAGASGLDGARATLVSADGLHVYVASGGIFVGPAAHAIAAFARDTATGLLTFVGAWENGVDGVQGLVGVYDLALTANGASLYAASFASNAVVAFVRDPATGALAFQQVIFDGPARTGGAHAVATSPDDAHVYVAAFAEPGIAELDHDPATGALAPAGFVASDVCRGFRLRAAGRRRGPSSRPSVGG
jgi:6-phosphogluconolactonase (cycloisomerase 2 family)